MLARNLAFHSAEEYTAEIAPYVESLARFWNVQDSLDELEGVENGKGKGGGGGGI